MKSLQTIIEELARPFSSDEIEWKPATSGKAGDKAWVQILCWLDARTLMERFDAVCPDWQVRYAPGPMGGISCAISIKDPITGEWLTREDGAGQAEDNGGLDASDIQKSGYTLAFRRAAAAWGCGRYLWIIHDGPDYADIWTRPGNPPKGQGWKKTKIKTGDYVWWKPGQEAMAKFQPKEPKATQGIDPMSSYRLTAAIKSTKEKIEKEPRYQPVLDILEDETIVHIDERLELARTKYTQLLTSIQG